MKFSVRRKPFDLLDLTPLIDVVFLLLIFFMVSTTFIHEPGGIKVDLPHSDTQEFIRESGEVVVEITENGGLFVDDVPVDEAALRAALRRTMRADPESVVIIKADRGVEHGRVVQVMDWSKRAGLYRLAVATEGSRLQRPLRDAGGSQ